MQNFKAYAVWYDNAILNQQIQTSLLLLHI